jgi:hypothetical protein
MRNILIISGKNSETKSVIEKFTKTKTRDESFVEGNNLYILKASKQEEISYQETGIFILKNFQASSSELSLDIFENIAMTFSDTFIFNFHWSDFILPSLKLESKVRSFLEKIKNINDSSKKNSRI